MSDAISHSTHFDLFPYSLLHLEFIAFDWISIDLFNWLDLVDSLIEANTMRFLRLRAKLEVKDRSCNYREWKLVLLLH